MTETGPLETDVVVCDALIMLVIGDMSEWTRIPATRPEVPGFHFADLADLTADLLHELSPDVILSPLVTHTFDVMDVAAQLSRLGYRGRYRAIAECLPSPELVLAEVAIQAADIDFDILNIDQLEKVAS